jgi:hypothetical protein
MRAAPPRGAARCDARLPTLGVMSAEFEERCLKRFFKRSALAVGILVAVLIAVAIVIATVG